MNRKKLMIFLPMVALFVAALACGGSNPVTMTDLPVVESAVKVEAGQSTMADVVVEALKESVGQEGVTAETAMYSLPADTSWDTIKRFYTSNLGSDWTEDAALSETQEGFTSSGWTRGSFASKQALVIALVDDPFAEQRFLVVVLFSE